MPSGGFPEVFAAQILFWVLLPLVFVAPPRWALLAWLLMCNLDATGPGQSSLTEMGWINGAKAIGLPLVLWWRFRRVPSEIQSLAPARLWLILTIYAAAASVWSPFPLAAIKLVGNLLGIYLMFVVIEKSARLGLLSSRTFGILIIASLLLGVAETYYYGGAAYGGDGPDRPTRFSSFVAAQQYAALLVAFLTLLVWKRGFRTSHRLWLGAAVTLALAMNGSRIWFFGASLVLVAYVALSSRQVFAFVILCTSTIVLAVLLFSNFDDALADPLDVASSRIGATVNVLLRGQDTARNIGLADLNFRLTVYQATIREIRQSDLPRLLFGHGTSSGGSVIMKAFPQAYRAEHLDANRVIHNEWLRALYEWGLIGLGLLIGVFASLVGGLIIRYRAHPNPGTPAILSFLPAFLLAFSGENVIAGAGNAVTVSLAIIVAILWAPDLKRPKAMSAAPRAAAKEDLCASPC